MYELYEAETRQELMRFMSTSKVPLQVFSYGVKFSPLFV